MANLQETATWEDGVRQLEITDPVLGGPNGIDNIAPRQLANRTLFLKGRVDTLQGNITQANANITNLEATKETKAVVSSHINNLNAYNVTQDARATAIESVNSQQSTWLNALDGGLSAVESVNSQQNTWLNALDGGLSALVLRVAELERKASVFAIGGGMVLWQKAANLIPVGWAEVVNWRGRMPIGWNPNDPDFQINSTGGNKTKTLSLSEMPPHKHTSYFGSQQLADFPNGVNGANNKPGTGDSLDNDNYWPYTSTEGGVSGSAQSFSILNPYRVVMFIEYVG